MLVEFKRHEAGDHYPRAVEDEEIAAEEGVHVIPQAHDRKISVNPNGVHAVIEMRDGISTVIRLADGRGFRIAGNYSEVIEKLRAAGNPAAGDNQVH